MCGFNSRMVQGIAIFAEGLFEATVERAKENNISIDQSFNTEIKEIQKFLEALEGKHQELKKSHTPEETMTRVVKWIDEQERV